MLDTLTPEEISEAFRSAWETTGHVCEWALSALDRVFKVLESMSKASKRGGQRTASAIGLAAFIEALFGQMSADLYKMVRLSCAIV